MKFIVHALIFFLVAATTAFGQSNTEAVYAYSLGQAPKATINQPSSFVAVTESKDIFRLSVPGTQVVELVFEEPAILQKALIKYDRVYRGCLTTGTPSDCRAKADAQFPGPNKIDGLQAVAVPMASNESLLLKASSKIDGSGIVELFVQKVGISRKVGEVSLADVLGSNLVIPSVLVGDRKSSQLGGYNGQPTILMRKAQSLTDHLFAMLERGVDATVALSPVLTGIQELVAPEVAYAQDGGGARMYTMNGFGQGRSSEPDTFAGDMDALEQAANEAGLDLDVRQVLYSNSWRGVGVCEAAKEIAKAIMADIAKNPLEPGEKLCIAGHSYGALLAMVMKSDPNCLPPGFPTFCVYAYDPPLTGQWLPGWLPTSQLGGDMLPGSPVLTGAAQIEDPTVKRRSRRNPDGSLKPYADPGSGDTPDHDPYEKENRDRPANEKERSEVRQDILKFLGL